MNDWKIQWLDEVDSTNALLKRQAAEGAPHGTVAVTQCQTAGRGRLGRRFASPEGGVYCSVLLRPETTEGLMCLTAAAAVAVCRAIEAVVGVRPDIKWRNDLLLGGKKLCGILTELAYGDSGLDYAVIGIGINCNTDPMQLPPEVRDIATSLRTYTGRTVEPHALAVRLVAELAAMDAAYPRLEGYMKDYARFCCTVGQDILVLRAGESRPAKAVRVDETGALCVVYDSGETEALSTGEVSVRGRDGYAPSERSNT